MRPIVSAVIAVTLAAAGCAKTEIDTSSRWLPQNDGANADVGTGVHVRNAFLLNGTDPASPAPEQGLFVVLINEGHRPDQLERITLEGGGTVRLPGPIALPPNQPVGVGERPLFTVSGVRGTTVPMTFLFRNAGPVRIIVPVKLKTGQFASLNPSPAEPASPMSAATAPPTPSPESTGSPGSTGSPAAPGSPAASGSPSPSHGE
ncbi:hypothetical protein [Nonomuraea sp. NPDC002799]